MKLRKKRLWEIICFFMVFSIHVAFADTIKWDMANEFPATSLHGENDAFFSKTLKEESNGRIIITHHYGASLGFKAKDQFDAVSDRAIPIANTYIGPLVSIHPIFLLPSLPFLSKSIDETRILWEITRPQYEKIFAKYNQIILYASPWPPSGIWAKKAIRTKNDLKNLKIRTYDSNGTITFKNVEAAPLQVAMSEMIPLLSTGAIDAILTSAEGGVTLKFWDQLNCFSDINYSAPLNIIHMNKDVYQELPGDLQKALRITTQKTSDYAWAAAKKRVEENFKFLKEHQVTLITDIPDALMGELSSAGKLAIDSWLEKMGPLGSEILSEYQKAKTTR